MSLILDGTTGITFTTGGLKLVGSTSGTCEINATAVSGTSVLTMPAATDTLVGKDTTDTLTNKTLVAPALGTPASGVLTNCTFPTLNQDTTGTSAKTNALNSATTIVNVSSATAPTSGQILTATSGTAATWQTPAAGGVTTFAGGTTGLTPAGATSGAITLAGTLAVANGGTGVTTSTGSGANVLGTSPTLVTPILGTPTSGNLANCTGIPAPAALSTASGSAPSYSARAWVNFNGTGTVAIRASGNVSSITDNGTGDYTVNFTTAMSDANYALNGTTINNGQMGIQIAGTYNGSPSTYTTSAVRINSTQSNTYYDCTYILITIFR